MNTSLINKDFSGFVFPQEERKNDRVKEDRVYGLSKEILEIEPALVQEKPLRAFLRTEDRLGRLVVESSSSSLKELTQGKQEKNSLRILKASKLGQGGGGQVKFVQFKSDPSFIRWFAVKRPWLTSENSRQHLEYLERYKNNVAMAQLIGEHPNFMKVHGVVVQGSKKVLKEGQEIEKRAKPYLILEYIEGDGLFRLKKHLTSEQKLHLFAQMKTAFGILFEKKIAPNDIHTDNMLVTKKMELKLIDFDLWEHKPDASDETIGKVLLEAGLDMIAELGKWEHDRPTAPAFDGSRKGFDEALDQLANLLKSKLLK